MIEDYADESVPPEMNENKIMWKLPCPPERFALQIMDSRRRCYNEIKNPKLSLSKKFKNTAILN